MESTPPLDQDPVIELYKRDVDRTLIRANVALTVTERFENLMALQMSRERSRKRFLVAT